MKPRFSFARIALRKTAPAVIVVALSSTLATAAIRYWDTNGTGGGLGGGTGAWDLSTTNWNTATAGTAATVAFVEGDDAFFQTAVANTVSLGANLTANSITQATNSTATTINAGVGNSISLTTGNITNTGNLALVINPDIALGATGAFLNTQTAGVTTLNGVVSGAFGISKKGIGGNGGTASLNNTANSYSGTTTVNIGTLAFAGSGASGTPFGTGSMVLAGSGSNASSATASILGLAPTTASGSAAYTGGTTAASTLSFSNTGYLVFTQGATSDLTYTFGPGSGTVLNRSGKGVLVMSTGTSVPTSTTLGSATGSRLIVNGTAPTLTNSMVAAYFIGAANGSGGAGTFLTYDNTNGFTPVTYDITGIDLSASTSADKVNITDAATVSADAAAYAVAVNAATTIDTDITLNIGTGSTPAGLILNNTLSGGTVNFGASEGIVFVGGASKTVSSVIAGSGGLTKTQYNGTLGELTLAATNTYTGDTNIQAGKLIVASGAAIASGSNVFVNASQNMGGIGIAYNLTNNGTIGGNLHILGPQAGSYYAVNTTQPPNAPCALLADGSVTSAAGTITVDGLLSIDGNATVGTIASTGSGNTGTGVVVYKSTSGLSLHFANGTSLTRLAPTSGSIGTLNSPGTVNLFSYAQTDNIAFDITIGSGTWNIAQTGQNNTGAQTGGTTNVLGGATVNLAPLAAGAWTGQGASQGGRWMHGIYNIGGASAGTINITGNVDETNGRTTTPPPGATNGLQFTVGNEGVLTVSGTTTLAINGAQTTGQTNSITVNTGGSATLTGAVTLGANVANGAAIDTNTITVAGGTLTVNNTVNIGSTNTAATGYSNNFNVSSGSATVVNLMMGSANNAASNTVANTVNLSGGKLLVSGSTGITAGVGNNQANVFNWTAGQLSAFKITPGAKFTAPVSGGITTTGLVNSGGILAPGNMGIAGNTTIAGDYTQQAGGTLAIDIAGTNQTGAFQNTVDPSYDNVLLSGATANVSLNGNLQVSLAGFTPVNGSSFTIIRPATAELIVSGAFSNVAFGSRITTQGGEGSFLLTNTGASITLSDYQSAGGTTFNAWITPFGVSDPSVGGDPDNDGLDNGVEHILGSDPSVYSTGLNQLSATPATLKFRHNQTNELASDVTKSYQWSTDLVEWKSGGQANAGGTTATIAETTITDNTAPANDVIEVTVTVSGTTASKVFARPVATKTP